MGMTGNLLCFAKRDSWFSAYLSFAAVLLLGTGALCQQYYPPNVFDEFTVKWYTSDLTALQEPSIWELSQTSDAEVYRFLWLRAFHGPVAIRLIVQRDGSGQLIAKVLGGRGSPTVGKLVENRTLQLSKEHVQWFLDAIDRLKYWELKPGRELGGCDGADWILEGAKNHHYSAVQRWSPTEGPIRTLGFMMLFEMAHLKISREEIY
jgi:hypothetical protein